MKKEKKYRVEMHKFLGYGEDGCATYEITFNKSLEHTGRINAIADGLNAYCEKEKKKYPEIILNGLQIKSLEKAFKLSDALSIIEEECGIKEVKITLRNIFVCAWIDLEKLNRNEMDLLLKDILNN